MLRQLHGVRWVTLFAGLVGVDQLSKAVMPRARVSFDPGAGTWLPGYVGSVFKAAWSGEVVDWITPVLLFAFATIAILHARTFLSRGGATVLVAGVASNLLDRLGLAEISQGASGRVVVNWMYFRFAGVGFGNVADFCCAVGSTMLLVAAALHVQQMESRLVSAAAQTSARVPAVEGLQPMF